MKVMISSLLKIESEVNSEGYPGFIIIGLILMVDGIVTFHLPPLFLKVKEI